MFSSNLIKFCLNPNAQSSCNWTSAKLGESPTEVYWLSTSRSTLCRQQCPQRNPQSPCGPGGVSLLKHPQASFTNHWPSLTFKRCPHARTATHTLNNQQAVLVNNTRKMLLRHRRSNCYFIFLLDVKAILCLKIPPFLNECTFFS